MTSIDTENCFVCVHKISIFKKFLLFILFAALLLTSYFDYSILQFISIFGFLITSISAYKAKKNSYQELCIIGDKIILKSNDIQKVFDLEDCKFYKLDFCRYRLESREEKIVFDIEKSCKRFENKVDIQTSSSKNKGSLFGAFLDWIDIIR